MTAPESPTSVSDDETTRLAQEAVNRCASPREALALGCYLAIMAAVKAGDTSNTDSMVRTALKALEQGAYLDGLKDGPAEPFTLALATTEFKVRMAHLKQSARHSQNIAEAMMQSVGASRQ